MLRSRLAPTPSGYLHIGNAFNFVITWLLTRSQGGRIRLRIDDLDAARMQPAYLSDIFRSLEWLGLDWDEGPTSPDDHRQHHSQSLRHDRYHQALATLVAQGHLFACTCSRREIQAHSPDGQYPGTCRTRAHDLYGPRRAWRLLTPQPAAISWVDGWRGPQHIDLYAQMRDPVLRRKDGLPAYQLASVVDDLDHGVTLIVRGQDLIDSSAAQRFLAAQAGWLAFADIALYHHPLLADAQGQKLSKSEGAPSLRAWRSQHATAAVFYHWLSQQLGWYPLVSGAEEALARFRTDHSWPQQLSTPGG
jgi:glutamyl-tRNA synthetase